MATAGGGLALGAATEAGVLLAAGAEGFAIVPESGLTGGGRLPGEAVASTAARARKEER